MLEEALIIKQIDRVFSVELILINICRKFLSETYLRKPRSALDFMNKNY